MGRRGKEKSVGKGEQNKWKMVGGMCAYQGEHTQERGKRGMLFEIESF